MSATITLPRGRIAAPRKPAPRRPPSRAADKGIRLPVAPARARRLLAWTLAVLLAVAAIAAVLAARLPQRAVEQAIGATARAGLELTDIRVTGNTHLPTATIAAAALPGGSSATLAFSPEDARARLRVLPWIADAIVARRLPGTLAITVTERVPAARFEAGGRVTLIDAGGHALPVADLAPFVRLPLIAGTGAAGEYTSLMALLKTAPAVRPNVARAAWRGGRRWDLTLASGETLALPEGYANAETALADFARLNAAHRLVGQGATRFDFRLPGRMVVRVPHPAVAAPKPKGTAI